MRYTIKRDDGSWGLIPFMGKQTIEKIRERKAEIGHDTWIVLGFLPIHHDSLPYFVENDQPVHHNGVSDEAIVEANGVVYSTHEFYKKNKINDAIPKPIGSFIIEQRDIKPLMLADGAYYHYSDVCQLLERLKKNKNEIL